MFSLIPGRKRPTAVSFSVLSIPGAPIDPYWNRLLDHMPGYEADREIAVAAHRLSGWPVMLAVCAIFRNEARHLAEWVAFHLDQGVQRFYLYNNESTDDWQPALAPHADVIEVTDWPGEAQQKRAYHDCFIKHRLDTRWMAMIDIDEFLFSPPGASLPEVLNAFPPVAAVAANWRTYGTSGHRSAPAGRTLAGFTHRAVDHHPINTHIKSIVFPMLVVAFSNAHHFIGIGPTLGERGDLVESPWRAPPTAELLRVNHYYTRSLSEFEAKTSRIRPTTDEHPPEPDHEALNAVYDPILALRAPRRAAGRA